MATKKKTFKCWIAWGEQPDSVYEYEFKTEEERAAYLQGVDDASGWMDYECFLTKKEADEFEKELGEDEDGGEAKE